MNAALELHSVLSLKLDARDAYRLAHAYRSEALTEVADSLRRALTTMVADDLRRPGIAFACGALTGFAAGGAVAEAGKDIRDGIQPSADESTQPTGAIERVTVYLTASSSAALIRAAETTGDTKTDTINRAIQTYALMVGEVADGGRVLVRHQGESTQPAPSDLTPLAIRWDRLVMHPSGQDTNTIVCCIAADTGRPVALFLDDEHREALGLQLVDPDGDNEVYADVPDDRCSACGCIDPGCTTCTSGTCRNDDADEWVRCSASHCPNGERFAKATKRGWTHHHMDTWRCPDHPVRPDAPTYADTRGEPGGDH